MGITHGGDIGIHGVMNLDVTLEEVARALKQRPIQPDHIYYGESSIRKGHKVLDISDYEGLTFISIYDDGVVYCGGTDDSVS